MKTKYLLMLTSLTLLGIWVLCRDSSYWHTRLYLTFYGYPFAWLQTDSRGGDNLAYRLSVYHFGTFVGTIDRGGLFTSATGSFFGPRDIHALQGTIWFLQYAPWLSLVIAGISSLFHLCDRPTPPRRDHS